jgi:hypothetical protein
MQNPRGSQEQVLERLLSGYARTKYGVTHGAPDIEGIDTYRIRFPISTYQSLAPYIAKVSKGEYSALLSEPVRTWVMTRGTTGASKVLRAILRSRRCATGR